MGIIEGYANIVSNQEFNEEEKNYHLKIFALIIGIKLLLILFVGKVLWPRVMPQISPGIKQNPSFLSLVGLMLIFNLLF